MIRIKKKIIRIIVIVAAALLILNIALNFKEYSFKFGNIPEEFVLNKDDISYCIEIDRRLDKEAQNKPSMINTGCDRLYIMQDKKHNRIYILESTI